jgi:hypothetical protein
MSESAAIRDTAIPNGGTNLRGRARPTERSNTAIPRSVNDTDAGGPMRPGATAALFPHCVNISNVSIPRSTPVRCSNRVAAPVSPTPAPKTIFTLLALPHFVVANNNAAAAAIVATAVLGNIEIPLPTQSVRRGTFASQPNKAADPLMSANEANTITAQGVPGHLVRGSLFFSGKGAGFVSRRNDNARVADSDSLVSKSSLQPFGDSDELSGETDNVVAS